VVTTDIRTSRYQVVSRRLAGLNDADVMTLLARTSTPTVGFGGTTSTTTIDGVPVFVKRVPLTDLERRPENAGSTANLFGLPNFYQYGIGSTGFGVWRELAVHTMTTRWVLERQFAGFPLLYHWRVLPHTSPPMDSAELEQWVTHWDGSDAVRARLEAIGSASAAVVLFLEHIPQTVDAWLTAAGDEAAWTFVHDALEEGVDFLRARGLVHFDAHFHNLLTDGQRLYFADFGLAAHEDFDLDTDFFDRHRNYDRFYAAAHLSRWLVHNLLDIPWADCPRYIRDRAPDLGLPAAAARIVARHARVTAVLDDFFEGLFTRGKQTPYPADELSQASA
jgi:hypothetical protein